LERNIVIHLIYLSPIAAMPTKGKPRKNAAPRVLGPLVPISRARLETWISRRDLSRAEVARRAGMLPQKLHHIVAGNVVRIREEYLTRLADALHLSVPFLRGDPDAPGPAGSTAVIQPLVVEPPAEVAHDPESAVDLGRAATRAAGEREALLADLARVFPYWYQETARALAEEAERRKAQGIDDLPLPTVEEALREANFGPSAQQFAGTSFMLGLDRLQRFVAGGAIVPPMPQAVRDQFTTDMARVIGAIVEPWVSGRAPSPPAGDRIARAAAFLGIELGLAVTDYFQPDPEVLDAVVAEMERMATKLEDVRLRRAR
jgi:transcriptional regulator with XRE-family HTH domain